MNYTDCMHYFTKLEAKSYPPDHKNSLNLMAYLDHPEANLPIVHIAGTNGKGSVANYIKNILSAAHYTVGTFLSPHIFDYKELITDSKGPITEKDFAISATEVITACEKMSDNHLPHPTVFECLVALSLVHFRNIKPDLVIIEVGLGGTYDATNVFKQPLLSIITPISYDHEAWLGHRLPDIASHKAGIIKANTPVILAPNPIEVVKVITDQVKKVDTHLSLLDEGLIHIKILMNSPKRKLFNIKTPFYTYTGLQTKMLGHHQEINIATALLAINKLRQYYKIDDSAVKHGIKNTSWTCRNDLISYDPPILIDGGHNPAGLEALARLIKEYYGSYKVITILGILKDKSYQEMIHIASGFSHTLIVTKPDSPRSLDMAQITFDVPIPTIKIDNYKAALDKGLTMLSDDTLLVVTGSLYLAYPAKLYLLNHLGTVAD